MTTTTELHAAIAQMQALMKQAADVIEHNASSLGEAHTRNGIIEDREVQAAVESDTDLVAQLRAAALPWDQRHKQPDVDCHATGVCVQSGLRAEQPAPQQPKFSARDDAERLKSVGRGMSYNDASEAVWKHTLMEIAMRLETGGYTSPPAQRKPLTEHQTMSMTFNHHWLTSMTLRDAYRLGIRDAEAAHGIKEQQPIASTLTKSDSRSQCWKCGDSDPAYTDVCQVPACGMREGN